MPAEGCPGNALPRVAVVRGEGQDQHRCPSPCGDACPAPWGRSAHNAHFSLISFLLQSRPPFSLFPSPRDGFCVSLGCFPPLPRCWSPSRSAPLQTLPSLSPCLWFQRWLSSKVPVGLPLHSIAAKFLISGSETEEMKQFPQYLMNNVCLNPMPYPGLQT